MTIQTDNNRNTPRMALDTHTEGFDISVANTVTNQLVWALTRLGWRVVTIEFAKDNYLRYMNIYGLTN